MPSCFIWGIGYNNFSCFRVYYVILIVSLFEEYTKYEAR